MAVEYLLLVENLLVNVFLIQSLFLGSKEDKTKDQMQMQGLGLDLFNR